MIKTKLDPTIIGGLVLTTFAWLSYVFYDFNVGIFSRHVTQPLINEDIPAVWGLGFRMGAVTIAVLIVLFVVVSKQFSRSDARMAFRVALLFEALYFIGFLGGALNIHKHGYFTIPHIIEEVVPTWVDALLLPAVLFALFFALNPSKGRKSWIKWTLIYITSFTFAFWLNNAGAWIGTVVSKGISYLTQYPVNLLSFTVTVVGLFALFLSAAIFTSQWLKIGTLAKLDLRKISTIVTLLGLYPLFILLLWLFFGSVGGWGVWYAWFLGHGYMSFIALPITFVTLPLLFKKQNLRNDAAKKPTVAISRRQLAPILYVTQALGVIFFIVFSLAYYVPFPTTHFLIGTQPYSTLMIIFGILYLISAVILTALSYITNVTDDEALITEN